MGQSSIDKLKTYLGTSEDIQVGRKVVLAEEYRTEEVKRSQAAAVPPGDWKKICGQVLVITEVRDYWGFLVGAQLETEDGSVRVSISSKDGFLRYMRFVPKRRVILQQRADAIS